MLHAHTQTLIARYNQENHRYQKEALSYYKLYHVWNDRNDVGKLTCPEFPPLKFGDNVYKINMPVQMKAVLVMHNMCNTCGGIVYNVPSRLDDPTPRPSPIPWKQDESPDYNTTTTYCACGAINCYYCRPPLDSVTNEAIPYEDSTQELRLAVDCHHCNSLYPARQARQKVMSIHIYIYT